MTKKERSIIACHLQAEKYRNAKEVDVFFNTDDCSLCKIHHVYESCCCKGCPLSIVSAYTYGCQEFKTYEEARINFPIDIETFPENPSTQLLDAFEQRAKFYDWLAVELEKYPASQFTKEGWKDFEIDKSL